MKKIYRVLQNSILQGSRTEEVYKKYNIVRAVPWKLLRILKNRFHLWFVLAETIVLLKDVQIARPAAPVSVKITQSRCTSWELPRPVFSGCQTKSIATPCVLLVSKNENCHTLCSLSVKKNENCHTLCSLGVKNSILLNMWIYLKNATKLLDCVYLFVSARSKLQEYHFQGMTKIFMVNLSGVFNQFKISYVVKWSWLISEHYSGYRRVLFPLNLGLLIPSNRIELRCMSFIFLM